MVDLEDRIHAWVEDQAEAVAPVTVDEIFAAPTSTRRPARGRTWWSVAAAVLVVLVGGAVVGVTTRRAPSPQTVHAGTPASTVRVQVGQFGWTLERPRDWVGQAWDDCGPETGWIVTNRTRPLPHDPSTGACESPWRSPALTADDLVAVEVLDTPSDMPSFSGAVQRSDTLLPLSIRDLHEARAGTEPVSGQRSMAVQVAGEPFVVQVFTGRRATREDRDAASRIVASVHWTYHGIPPAEVGDPVWPDTPVTRHDPSQSPAAARRDGVVAELARLPLARRAQPHLGVADPSGSTWWLTQPSLDVGDASSGAIGDPNGAEGTELIGTGEYGEILLLDAGSRVERAYPMPELAPTWLYVTTDATYAGRTGDGADPDSSIVRIDRRTHEARTVVFPHAGPSGDAGTSVRLPGWTDAPAGASIGQYVHVDRDRSGTQVSSWIGRTVIDLPRVEALFAGLPPS